MATASRGVRAGAASLAEGSKEDVGEGVLTIRSHFMALFSLRASSDPDVVDFKMWTLKSDEGESYPTKEVVCAYRTRDKMNKKGGWICLILVEHDVDSARQKEADASKSRPDAPSFVKFFEVFLRLKGEAGVFGKYGRNMAKVVFYTEHSGAVFPAEMLERAKEKDFMFREELLQCKDDVRIKKELIETINKEFILMAKDKAKRRPMNKYCKSRLHSDIEGFIRNSYYTSSIPPKEELRQSMKKGARACPADSSDDRVKEIFEELTKMNLLDFNAITEASLSVYFEGMKIGRDGESKMTFNLCEPVPDFVGRVRELRQVLHFLGGTSSHKDFGPAKKVVVSGYPGVGKSELAREYCRRHSASSLYDSIAWIHAENEERIAASFRALATEKLGLKVRSREGSLTDSVAVSKECFELLKTRRALLVFDNAESLQQVKQYLPGEVTKGRLYIILTSRLQEWGDIPLVLLESFNPKDALELVKGSLGQLPSWREDEGQSLCKTLGYYPLALKQAVSYILEQQLRLQKDGKTYRINDYLKMRESKVEAFWDKPTSRSINSDQAETTHRVMMTTLKYLKKTLGGQMAVTILNILSYLSPDYIDVESMSNANPKFSKEGVTKSLSVLAKLSLISLDFGRVRIHRLVQLLNRNILRKSGLEVSALKDAMGFAVPMGVQHMLSVWEWVAEHRSLVVKFAHIPLAVFKELDKEGLHEIALSSALSAESSLRNVLGHTHPGVLNVMRATAQAYLTLGEKKKSISKLKDILDSIRSLREPKSPEYFDELLSYGRLLSDTWYAEESLSVFKEIISDGPSILGEASDVVQAARLKLIVLENGHTAWINNAVDFTKMIEWCKEKLEPDTERKRSASEHDEPAGLENMEEFQIDEIDACRGPLTLPSTLNYLPILRACGRYQEAFVMMSNVYEVVESTFGESYPLTLSIKYELIKLQLELGNVDAAQSDMELLLARMGPGFRDNKFRVEVENLRGIIFFEQGKNNEAIQLFLSLCLHKEKDSIDEEGLYTVSNTLKYLLTMEKYTTVSRVMNEVFQTISALGREINIPKPFLEFSVSVCLTLSDQGMNEYVLGILKNVHLLYRQLMGDSHMETCAVRLAFACICCATGEENGIAQGVRYFKNIRETLLVTHCKGDQRVLEMAHEVTKLLKKISPEES